MAIYHGYKGGSMGINKERFGWLATELQGNMMKEAEAVMSYQMLRNQLKNNIDGWKRYPAEGLEAPSKEDIKFAELMLEQVEEFIRDELNHQENLTMLYKAATGSKPAKD